jgi:hypothetical protein
VIDVPISYKAMMSSKPLDAWCKKAEAEEEEEEE